MKLLWPITTTHRRWLITNPGERREDRRKRTASYGDMATPEQTGYSHDGEKDRVSCTHCSLHVQRTKMQHVSLLPGAEHVFAGTPAHQTEAAGLKKSWTAGTDRRGLQMLNFKIKSAQSTALSEEVHEVGYQARYLLSGGVAFVRKKTTTGFY